MELTGQELQTLFRLLSRQSETLGQQGAEMLRLTNENNLLRQQVARMIQEQQAREQPATEIPIPESREVMLVNNGKEVEVMELKG